jgi:hypothetical protein
MGAGDGCGQWCFVSSEPGEPLPEQATVALAMSTLRPLLPKGAYLSQNHAVGVEISKFRFIYWRDSGRWALLPASGKIDNDLLQKTLGVERQELGELYSQPEVNRQTLFLHAGIDQAWPLLERGEATSFFCLSAGLKLLLFFIDEKSGEALAVVKLPREEAMEAALLNEARTTVLLSNQHVGVTPWILYKGNIQRPADGSNQAYYMYEYLSGSNVEPQSTDAPLNFLQQLIQPDSQTSARSIAALLAKRLDKLALEPERKLLFSKILDQITDARGYSASILHGDFRPANLLHGTGGGDIQAMDWKFARGEGLGFLDYIQFVLDPFYTDPSVTCWADLYTTQVIRRLRTGLAEFYSPTSPPLEQLLQLQFCLYLIDRISCRSPINSDTLTRLENMAAQESLTDWLAKSTL